MLICGAVYVEWPSGDERNSAENEIQGVLLTGFITISIGLLMVPIRLILLKLFKPDKRYKYFLSHQKSAAGGTARWLQMTLGPMVGGTDRIFLDSDHLVNLGTLLTTVQDDVGCLVTESSRVYSSLALGLCSLMVSEVAWSPLRSVPGVAVLVQQSWSAAPLSIDLHDISCFHDESSVSAPTRNVGSNFLTEGDLAHC